MEWLVLLIVAAGAAAYIALPAPGPGELPEEAGEALRVERRALLAMLREFDDDAATGRISAEDRLEGRRALAPRLRAVTEALSALGESDDPIAAEPDGHEDLQSDAEPMTAARETQA